MSTITIPRETLERLCEAAKSVLDWSHAQASHGAWYEYGLDASDHDELTSALAAVRAEVADYRSQGAHACPWARERGQVGRRRGAGLSLNRFRFSQAVSKGFGC